MSMRDLRASYQRGAYSSDLGRLARDASWSARPSGRGAPWAGWLVVPAAAALAVAIGVGWWVSPWPQGDPIAAVPATPPTVEAVEPAPTTAVRPTSRRLAGFAVPDRPMIQRRTPPTRGLSAPTPTSSLTRAQRQRMATLSVSRYPSIPSFPSNRSAPDATPSS